METIQMISFTLLGLSTHNPVTDWTNTVILSAHRYLYPSRSYMTAN